MQRHIALIILAVLILIAGTAQAKDPSLKQNPTTVRQGPQALPAQGMTTLQQHPMIVEMQTILRETREKEDALIEALKKATTEAEMEVILIRLERLDTDRELALLKVQARYAHKLGRFELEREIKSKIVDLLVDDTKLIQ